MPMSTLSVHVGGFFMIQPLALTLERVAIALYRTIKIQAMVWVSKRFGLEDATAYKYFAALELYFGRAFGYLWVFMWFVASGWIFLSIYALIGQGVWHAPYPVLEKYFSSGGVP